VSQDGVFTQDAASGRKTGRVAKRLTERGPSWVGRVVVILASHCPLEHTGTLTLTLAPASTSTVLCRPAQEIVIGTLRVKDAGVSSRIDTVPARAV
jgi:hypothetical protein